eukprot:scaffold35226_cov66-Phaeocystis_antarctica.AAC.3
MAHGSNNVRGVPLAWARWGQAAARPHPSHGPGPQPLMSCAWPSDLRGSPLPAVALRGGRYSVAPRSPRMASASSG